MTSAEDCPTVEERHVVVVAYDGAELLDIACVTSALDAANRLGGRPSYRVDVVSLGGHPIACDSGLSLRATGSLRKLAGPIDTLIVSGGRGHEIVADDPVIVAHVRRLAATSRRVASVCTGSTILAAAGLLDGRRATTHWYFAAEFARRYPAVRVDPAPIFIRDDGVDTAAGVTSALDLTLAFIQEDHGDALANQIARVLVTYRQRPGNQAQVSMFVADDPPDHRLVRAVAAHVAQHVDGDLDVAGLATRFGVSERQLGRLFLEHLGVTPGRYVRKARTEAAAGLLSGTSLPIATIATRCGFGTAEALRQAFMHHYGIAPSRYRQVHRAAG